MKSIILLIALLSTATAWSKTQIIGMTCQDYWNELKVAGVLPVYMDRISLSDLKTDFIADLLDPAGEPAGIERGEISGAITIHSCTFSRTGNILVSCRPQNVVGGGISFRYVKALGNNQSEENHVSRSMEVDDLKLDIVLKDAPDENGRVIRQPVLELSFRATVADGRTVNYHHERPFGKLNPDNTPGINWGRSCSFVTRWATSE